MSIKHLVVLALLSLSGNVVPAAQHTFECSGHECVAGAIVWPSDFEYWTITPSETNGRGQDAAQPCRECKFCKADVDWIYTGPTSYRVKWTPGGLAAGQGGGMSFGTFPLFNGCDQDPVGGSFTGGGEFGTVDLFCPCN
jgi:hypothetical protein